MFTVLFSYITGFIEISIQFLFFNKWMHVSGKKYQTIIFILLSSIISQLQLPTFIKLLLFGVLLLIYSTWVLKINIKSSILYILLIIEIMQLCYGIFNSISIIAAFFMYHLNPSLFSPIFMVTGTLLSLTLAVLCYQIISKYMRHKENAQNQYILMTTIPLLMIFIVSRYIHFTFYENITSIKSSLILLNKTHIPMLIIQILGIISIFSILYSYQKLMDSFFLHTKLSMLTQQTHFQRQYVKEAWAHYANTKALRHDMKNHIMIIKGLLEKQDFLKAKTYIDELHIATANTSFPFPTNNPILDILLENKIALANNKEIHINSSFNIPSPCTVTDMDFCIILSNALDNAINACEKIRTNQKKYIHISSHKQQDFLLVEIENSFDGNAHFKEGIGLSNIRWTAQKYDGTIEITTTNTTFCLSVLLVISPH